METVSRNFDCLKFFLVANGRLATANLENYLEYGPWCSRRRRIEETDISTPVTVDQRAANCLEEAVGSFIAMRSRFQTSCADFIFRHSLPFSWVIWCSRVHCFQTRTEQLEKIAVDSGRWHQHATIETLAVNECTASFRQLAARWSTAIDVLMPASSTCRRLLHRGLRAKVPFYSIPLTANHRRLRL